MAPMDRDSSSTWNSSACSPCSPLQLPRSTHWGGLKGFWGELHGMGVLGLGVQAKEPGCLGAPRLALTSAGP